MNRLSAALLGAGRLEEARSAAESSISLSLERLARVAKLDAEITLARILLAGGNATEHGQIVGLLDSATEGIKATSASVFEPFVFLARAELARITGDERARKEHLTAALDRARAMNAAGHVRATHPGRNVPFAVDRPRGVRAKQAASGGWVVVRRVIVHCVARFQPRNRPPTSKN